MQSETMSMLYDTVILDQYVSGDQVKNKRLNICR